MNKRTLVKLTISLILTLTILFSFLYLNNQRRTNAVYVLHLTMQFENALDIQSNMSKVEKYLTKELIKNYGLNNEDFTYYNFYKTKNTKTTVEILDRISGINDGAITFKLKNEFIDVNRKFVMIYKCKGFKFNKVDFYELAGKM